MIRPIEFLIGMPEKRCQMAKDRHPRFPEPCSIAVVVELCKISEQIRKTQERLSRSDNHTTENKDDQARMRHAKQ